jgi:hypothetical protein
MRAGRAGVEGTAPWGPLFWAAEEVWWAREATAAGCAVQGVAVAEDESTGAGYVLWATGPGWRSARAALRVGGRAAFAGTAAELFQVLAPAFDCLPFAHGDAEDNQLVADFGGAAAGGDLLRTGAGAPRRWFVVDFEDALVFPATGAAAALRQYDRLCLLFQLAADYGAESSSGMALHPAAEVDALAAAADEVARRLVAGVDLAALAAQTEQPGSDPHFERPHWAWGLAVLGAALDVFVPAQAGEAGPPALAEQVLRSYADAASWLASTPFGRPP